MKKILNLTGVQKLSREQQKLIKGAFRYRGCCSNNECKIGTGIPGPFGSFCEPGRCINGRCEILY